MSGYSRKTCTGDLVESFKRISLAGILGWQDVRIRYKRSALGPFWLTISMGVMISCIGLVFGGIFGTPMEEFLPFLAVGLIIWSFISSVLNEGGEAFISAEEMIKQLPVPLFIHIWRVIWRNVIVLLHNLVILPVLFIAFGKSVGFTSLASIIGLMLLLLNLSWVALLLGMVCARYRDLPQLVASLMQVLFYLTPVIWMPQMLPDRYAASFLILNPVYHLLEIVRAPLLGHAPDATSWYVAIIMGVVGWAVAFFSYCGCRRKIAYWL